MEIILKTLGAIVIGGIAVTWFYIITDKDTSTINLVAAAIFAIITPLMVAIK